MTNTPHSPITRTRVVVIGGGYAGTMAANRLVRPDINVTLVNPRPAFVERIRLHQHVGDEQRSGCDEEPRVAQLAEPAEYRAEQGVGHVGGVRVDCSKR